MIASLLNSYKSSNKRKFRFCTTAFLASEILPIKFKFNCFINRLTKLSYNVFKLMLMIFKIKLMEWNHIYNKIIKI